MKFFFVLTIFDVVLYDAGNGVHIKKIDLVFKQNFYLYLNFWVRTQLTLYYSHDDQCYYLYDKDKLLHSAKRENSLMVWSDPYFLEMSEKTVSYIVDVSRYGFKKILNEK